MEIVQPLAYMARLQNSAYLQFGTVRIIHEILFLSISSPPKVICEILSFSSTFQFEISQCTKVSKIAPFHIKLDIKQKIGKNYLKKENREVSKH